MSFPGARLLRRLGLLPVPEVRALDQLVRGPVAVRGTLASRDRLKSPIQSVTCIGFYYRASKRESSYTGQFVRLSLRKARVYAPGLQMKLDGGLVDLRPSVVEEFDAEAHARLKGHGYEDFKAYENRLIPGLEAIARGEARREGDAWIVEFAALEIIKKRPAR